MVVGEYSILSAIRRMDTFSYPSRTNNSLAASRISCRKNFFCLALRSFTPISQPVHLLNAVHYLLIADCLSIATSDGRAYSHRIPLAEWKCVSPKRRKEMAARLGGEPGGARGVDSQRHGRFRSLLRSGT